MYTNWEQVPLVVGKRQAAQVLGISPRTLTRRLQNGTMQPAPMPKIGRDYRWSKKTLQQYVDGGYRQYERRG